MTPLQIRALIARAKKENITLNQNVEKYLNLRILPSGKATWLCKMKIRYKTLNKTLGNYPEVSPVEARRLKNEWVQQMQITPENITPAYTVEDAFNDWAERKKQQVRSFDYMWMRVKNYILPAFGRVQLKDLTAIALIRAWQPLEAEGHIETCRKLCEYVKDMSVFALNTGRVETMHDLTHLKANYPPKKKKHLAAVSPEELPDLFYALERLPRIYGTVWQAMLCQFYTLSRPGEIAEMKWEWVDFDNRVIHFPAEIMKPTLSSKFFEFI